jgi:hypothetical protein
MSEQTPPPSVAAAAPAPKPAAGQAPVSLGAPLPAPVESTVPPEYKTPGLESADGADAAKAATPDAAADLPATFVAAGKVYGDTAGSQVTLQARKPTSLVVHGADGSVYFARQLAAGEAWRAPALKGLTVDVVEAGAVQAFVGGQSKGALPLGRNLISKLAEAPAGKKPADATPPAP